MQHWKTIIAVGFLIIAVGFFVRMVGDATIAFAETERTPPNAIPAYCEVSVAAGFTQTMDCNRGDDREPINTIPVGHFFLVTDIIISRDELSTSGSYFATIGKADGLFPTTPALNLSGTPLQSDAFHFQAPQIILRAGEALSVRNQSGSDFPLDVYVSGFLVTDVTYQVLFQNYLPLTTR